MTRESVSAPDEPTELGDVELSLSAAESVETLELARRLAAIVESSSDAIVGKTTTGIITSWNAGAEALYGYSASEAVGMSADMLIPASRAGEEQAMIARLLAGGPIREHETERQRKDGTIVPVSLTASLVVGPGGEVLGVATIARDVTERKAAEAVEARLAAIVKSSVDALIGLDLDGNITSWNPAAERLFGYPEADMVGRPVSLLVPRKGRNEQRDAIRRAVRGELVRDWETERLRRDGTPIPVSITYSLVRDGAGEPTGVAAQYRDMSERRHFERVHHIAETLQQALLPEAVEDVPGVAVCARYFPGGAGLDVGGDWYDVFPLSGGRLGVAVGDVVGRGVAAAAVMGQLRVALRAYALEFAAPATVLTCLGRLARSLDDSQMATVLYGVIDPEAGQVELASAGHPPPLVIRPDGEATFCDLDGAPPLGVGTDLPPNSLVESLEPGSMMLFYTDGLVERRGASIEDGMEALAKAAAGTSGVEALCDRVSDAMGAEDSADDVALLALSLTTRGT
jgi:PAS domain S-box-containing protein